MPKIRDEDLPPKARALVTEATRLLVTKEYDALERLSGGVRLSAVDLAQEVIDDGRPLSLPPAGQGADIVSFKDGSGWSVVVDLYTGSERSDLSLELSVIRVNGDFRLEVDGLHVR